MNFRGGWGGYSSVPHPQAALSLGFSSLPPTSALISTGVYKHWGTGAWCTTPGLVAEACSEHIPADHGVYGLGSPPAS